MATMKERKSHLVRAALLSTDWKTDYGLAVQVGIEGAVDDLKHIAEWMSEHRHGEVIAIDDMENSKASLLDNLKHQTGAHYIAPPTVPGNVRMYKQAPELHFPILFLSVATTNLAEIKPVLSNLQTGTIMYGSAEACAMACEAAECKAQPLYFHDNRVVVRIA